MTDDDKPADTTKKPVPPTSEDELNKIVQGILTNQVFTSNHVQNVDMIPMVFMPIALGGLADVDLNTLGGIYEYMDKASPRSINGYPTFFSCRLVNREDWQRVGEAVRKGQEALRAATV